MPKWSQNGGKWEPKMCPKSRFRKKVPKVVWTHYLLYILTTGTAKTSLFDTSKQQKCRSFPRGASDAAPGLQNGAHGAEKWREWGPWDPQGCQRVSQCLLKCSKKTSKISIPLQECLQGCLGCPTAPKIPPFFTFPRPTLPQGGGTFEPPLPLSPTPHSLPPPLI